MRKYVIYIIFLLSGVLFAGQSVALDKESLECLGCHDATLAADAAVMTVCPEPGCDHPIGVNYVMLSSVNHGLKPAVFLDPKIKLADNSMIGCTSCHVPYKKKDHLTLSTLRGLYPEPDPMLSVDSRESGLCFGCHYK